MKYKVLILAGLLTWGYIAPAAAQQINYVTDPLFEPISPGDPHPLQGLLNMAMDQDARAQFILGDLYSKGKGGVPRNRPLAKTLFEHSGKNGHYEAFIRLAAMAREDEDIISAWKWYSLADERLKWGETRDWAAQERQSLQREMSGAERRAARAAMQDWKIKRLPPLVLHDPLSPLGNSPSKRPASLGDPVPEANAEPMLDVIDISTDTEAVTEEEDPTDE